MSRDEISGYQLPRELSKLTKLNNNQILALPLALNLDKPSSKISVGSKSKEQNQQQQTSSDIKQIVIQAGQVLKICGIYENVIPPAGPNTNRYADPVGGSGGQFLINAFKKHTAATSSIQLESQLDSSQLYQIHQLAQAGFQPARRGKLEQQQLLFNEAQYAVALAWRNGSGKPVEQLVAPNGANITRQKAKSCRVSSSAKLADNSRSSRVALQGHNSGVGQVGQRYARCVLLNQKSIDQFTGCALSGFGKSEHEHEKSGQACSEPEVLIPLDQKGRFYLCATNQSIMNELHCFRCSTTSSNFIYRLSQIVSLINLTRRLSLEQSGGHNQERYMVDKEIMSSTSSSSARCEVRKLQLPLTAHLVIGPRPINFSPSMFGSSSTMDSYFRLESNVGGHRLSCKFNKNFVASNRQEPQETNLACLCALSLVGGGASGPTAYGLFSAKLRIERVLSRDVLLACTIRNNPLMTLDLFSNRGSSSSNLEARLQRARTCTSNASTSSSSSNRLSALRELAGQTSLLTKGEPISCETGKSFVQAGGNNKSSFSRLRMCRSLISLHGRRKRRPNIPSSMILSGSSASKPNAAGSGCTSSLLGQQADGLQSLSSAPLTSFSLQSDTFESSPQGGARGELAVGLAANTSQSQDSSGCPVMVEFDCSDHKVNFVRTFVENSIPTASIPDLVLNRMEFCNRNSESWERQLKLSYATLSRDFDTCQREMELSWLGLGRGSNSGQEAKVQPRRAVSVRSLAMMPPGGSQPGGGALESSEPDSSASSTSRSSSGVSSAAAAPKANHRSCSTLSSGSLLAGSTANQGARSTHRLLKFVHKILPPFTGSPGSTEDAAQLVGRRASTKTAKRGSELELLSESLAAMRPPGAQLDMSTLMNAQKVHRKLMSGRPDQDQEQQQQRGRSKGAGAPLVRSDSFSMASACEDRARSAAIRMSAGKAKLAHDASGGEESSESHMYESLERINEVLRNKKPLVGRRARIGKSMELLTGSGRITMLAGAARCVSGASLDDNEHELEAKESDQVGGWWLGAAREQVRSSKARAHDNLLLARKLGALAAMSKSGATRLKDNKEAQGHADERQPRRHLRRQAESTRGRLCQEDECATMEPVSIEACNDEFLSMLAADSDEPGEQSAPDKAQVSLDSAKQLSPAASLASRSSGQLVELIESAACDSSRLYANLLAPGSRRSSRSALSLSALSSSRQLGASQPSSDPAQASRMERKLARLRNRRPQKRPELDQWPAAPTGAREQQELELHSINLPLWPGERKIWVPSRRALRDLWPADEDDAPASEAPRRNPFQVSSSDECSLMDMGESWSSSAGSSSSASLSSQSGRYADNKAPACQQIPFKSSGPASVGQVTGLSQLSGQLAAEPERRQLATLDRAS